MRAGLLLLLLLAAPLAVAQDAPRAASFLVYHPWPDPHAGAADADALGGPAAPPPAGLARLPATRFDGVVLAAPAPEGTPESALAHFREFQRLLQQRERTVAGVPLTLAVEELPGALRVRVAGAGEARVVVFEHAVPAGGRPQPYVARSAATLGPLDGSTEREVGLDASWERSRLGVVAILERDGEVVQSATWLAGQDGPIVQTRKAVLVEHASATWCEPCAPADEALRLLASQYGAAGEANAERGYLRPPTALAWLGLALGAAASVVLWRRRA